MVQIHENSIKKKKFSKIFQVQEGKTPWEDLEYLQHEFKIRKTFSHPTVPNGIYTTSDGEKSVFCYDFAEGMPLSNYSRRFSVPEVKTIALVVLKVLEYLQSLPQPIIHGKINPDSIFCEEPLEAESKQLAYLAGYTQESLLSLALEDFRSAKRLGNEEDEKKAAPAPTSPYLPTDRPPSAKDLSYDLYGLGMVVVKLLTQVADSELTGLAKSLRDPDIPENLRPWLRKMLGKKGEKFLTAQAAREALEAIKEKPETKPSLYATLGYAMRTVATLVYSKIPKKSDQPPTKSYYPRNYLAIPLPNSKTLTLLAFAVGVTAADFKPAPEAHLQFATQILQNNRAIAKRYSYTTLLSTVKRNSSYRDHFFFGISSFEHPELGTITSLGFFNKVILDNQEITNTFEPQRNKKKSSTLEN